MGLISYESMQILIPTIPVGLFVKQGVNMGFDMPIVHDLGLCMQKNECNNYLCNIPKNYTQEYGVKFYYIIPTGLLGK